MKRSVVVIGGGPAGIMSAIIASKRGFAVTIIEKNEKLGKKLYITGKGRCNITNDCTADEFFKNINSNPKFLLSSLNQFSQIDLLNFFKAKGVSLKTERGGRVFPASDKSHTILDALKSELTLQNIDVKLNETCLGFTTENGIIASLITNKSNYVANSYIIATGGKSYPLTGSTGDGYAFAKKMGHEIIEPKAALAPIVFEKFEIVENYPQGLSLKNINATILEEGKTKPTFSEFGELLFTSCGVSGPTVLTLSSKISKSKKTNLTFSIDLKPALTLEQLNDRVLRDFEESKNKQFQNSLFDLLPKSLISYVIERTKIDPKKPVNEITKKERNTLTNILKNLTFKIFGVDDINSAIITLGGVCVKEIDPSTMRSKFVKNLYFAGEIIDVDAYTGGFNLQIAFSTGFVAGNSC